MTRKVFQKDIAMEKYMESGPASAMDKKKTNSTTTNSSSKTQNDEIKDSIQGVASDVKLLIEKQKEDHSEVTTKLNDIPGRNLFLRRLNFHQKLSINV